MKNLYVCLKLGAVYFLRLKGLFLVHSEEHSECALAALLVVRLMKDCFQTIPLQETKLK